MIRTRFNAVWDRWANFHPLLRFFLICVVLGMLGAFALKPTYNQFKRWRQHRNLVAAQVAINEVRMDDARDLSLTVLRSGNDPGIEAFRILEKSTAALRDPRHGEIARALMTHPKSTAIDHWTGFRGYVPSAPLGLAGQAWSGLSEENRQQPKFAIVFADRLISAKHHNDAAAVLLAVPETNRTSEVNVRLARILVRSRKEEGVNEAFRIATQELSENDSDAAQWFEVLEEIPPLNLRGSNLNPLRSLIAQPMPGITEARLVLMRVRMDYAADFNARAELIDQSVTRWKTVDPLTTAKFLSDSGLHRRLLEEFGVDDLMTHPKLFEVLLESAEFTEQWTTANRLLDARGSDMVKFLELGHRAIVATKSGDTGAGVQFWNAAMGEAKSDPAAYGYLELHRLASEAGMTERAEEAIVEAIRSGRGPLPLYADLRPVLSSLADRGRENTLLEICAIYVSLEPGNPVILTQYAHLALFNGLAPADLIVNAMLPLAKAFPKELPIQTVIAAAHLANQEPKKAAEIYDALQLDPEKMAPGYRAVFLVTQVLNQRMKRSDPAIRSFPWKSLQTSERRKLTELLGAGPAER